MNPLDHQSPEMKRAVQRVARCGAVSRIENIRSAVRAGGRSATAAADVPSEPLSTLRRPARSIDGADNSLDPETEGEVVERIALMTEYRRGLMQNAQAVDDARFTIVCSLLGITHSQLEVDRKLMAELLTMEELAASYHDDFRAMRRAIDRRKSERPELFPEMQ